ncbi:MAG: hypothetical protein ACREQV_18495 [Candidatus Binatia bacterium]
MEQIFKELSGLYYTKGEGNFGHYEMSPLLLRLEQLAAYSAQEDEDEDKEKDNNKGRK